LGFEEGRRGVPDTQIPSDYRRLEIPSPNGACLATIKVGVAGVTEEGMLVFGDIPFSTFRPYPIARGMPSMMISLG
jgi:hypothetical protein